MSWIFRNFATVNQDSNRQMKTTITFDGGTEVTVSGRSKKELFANIYSEIRKRGSECRISDTRLCGEYNKWCADHTSTAVVPAEIVCWHQARCGFAVPYSETYRKTLGLK